MLKHHLKEICFCFSLIKLFGITNNDGCNHTEIDERNLYRTKVHERLQQEFKSAQFYAVAALSITSNINTEISQNNLHHHGLVP